MFVEDTKESLKNETVKKTKPSTIKGVFSSDLSEDEMQEKPQENQIVRRDSQIILGLMQNFESEKLSKKISYNLNFKLKNEKTKIAEEVIHKSNNFVETIQEKETFFENVMTSQITEIEKRIHSRRMNSVLKKSRNTSVLEFKQKSMILDNLKTNDRSFTDNYKNGNVLHQIQENHNLKNLDEKGIGRQD